MKTKAFILTILAVIFSFAFYTCSKSVDTPKPKKTVYYRIKQVDKDGKTTTYNVVTVKE